MGSAVRSRKRKRPGVLHRSRLQDVESDGQASGEVDFSESCDKRGGEERTIYKAIWKNVLKRVFEHDLLP